MQANQLLLNCVLTKNRVILLTAFFLTATANWTFFRQVLEVYPLGNHLGFVASIGLLLFSFLALLMGLFAFIVPVRIVVTVFLITAVITAYFSDQFGTAMDSMILRSALGTTSAEAGDLFTWSLLWRSFLLGVLPVLLIWRLPHATRTRMVELRNGGLMILVTSTIILACLLAYGSRYASFFREHKAIRYYANPAFTFYSMGKIAAETFSEVKSGVFNTLTTFAAIPERDGEHELVIVVVGETARADHFSLNGYIRPTNPHLAMEENIVSFSRITSCGTSTEVSVPCIFGFAGRHEFSLTKARHSENVLDVLKKAGVKILWRNNSTGSKGVADRIEYQDFSSAAMNPMCDPECRDMGMLSGLQAYINENADSDILIVLHQMGSHGPAYYKRYPPEFEIFKPACRSLELSQCTPEQIINAYDNTLVYTDFFLSKVIELLKSNSDRFETTLLYFGDHGESLGEHGIYLHGLPYVIAPQTQTHVPLILWVGPTSDVDIDSARARKDIANSHDTIAMSLLQLFEIESDIHGKSYPPLFDTREK